MQFYVLALAFYYSLFGERDLKNLSAPFYMVMGVWFSTYAASGRSITDWAI